MAKYDKEKEDALRDKRVIGLMACVCDCTTEDVEKGIRERGARGYEAQVEER